MKIREILNSYSQKDPHVGKYSNYFSIYDEIFCNLDCQSARVLEIGVRHGGSLEIWKRALGRTAEIVGIDVMPAAKQFEAENISIVIGDQSDESFLKDFSQRNGEFDLIIDDGSHVCSHQKLTFEYLFQNNLKVGGYYVVEDCHTSYWPEYGGGYRSKRSFIEYAKILIDDLNIWHGATRRSPTSFSKTIKRISFESSVVVFVKGDVSAPEPAEYGGKKIDIETISNKGKVAPVINALRKNAMAKRLVRRSPFLWRMARRIIKSQF